MIANISWVVCMLFLDLSMDLIFYTSQLENDVILSLEFPLQR